MAEPHWWANRSHGNPGWWRRLRRQVFALKGRACHWCGAPATTVDHVTPRAEGGPDTIANLVPACRPCNSRRAGLWVAANRGRLRRLDLWPGPLPAQQGGGGSARGPSVSGGALGGPARDAAPVFEVGGGRAVPRPDWQRLRPAGGPLRRLRPTGALVDQPEPSGACEGQREGWEGCL